MIFRISKTPFEKIVKTTAMSKYFGFSFQEIVLKEDNRTLDAVYTIQPFTLDKFLLDPRTYELVAITQYSEYLHRSFGTGGGTPEIPAERLIYSVESEFTDDPRGYGLFRQIARHALRLIDVENREDIALQTHVDGYLMLYGPWDDIEERLLTRAKTDTERQEVAATLNRLKEPFKKFQEEFKAGRRGQSLLLDSAPYENFTRQTGDSKYVNTRKYDMEIRTGDVRGFSDIRELKNNSRIPDQDSIWD